MSFNCFNRDNTRAWWTFLLLENSCSLLLFTSHRTFSLIAIVNVHTLHMHQFIFFFYEKSWYCMLLLPTQFPKGQLSNLKYILYTWRQAIINASIISKYLCKAVKWFQFQMKQHSKCYFVLYLMRSPELIVTWYALIILPNGVHKLISISISLFD